MFYVVRIEVVILYRFDLLNKTPKSNISDQLTNATPLLPKGPWIKTRGVVLFSQRISVYDYNTPVGQSNEPREKRP